MLPQQVVVQDQRAAGLANNTQSEALGAHLDAAKNAQAVVWVRPQPLLTLQTNVPWRQCSGPKRVYTRQHTILAWATYTVCQPERVVGRCRAPMGCTTTELWAG